jgi:uncharacterized phage protein gp47/JayE
MQLPLQNFTTLVQNMAASVQSGAQALLDLTVGSVLRAILEANASAALWLQWIAVQVLSATRAATSTGPDLDTWVADFGVTRLPGQCSTGTVTFARITPGFAAVIPVGAQVKTGDATITFAVTADPTNPAFDPVNTCYNVPAPSSSVSVPVQAIVAGPSANVSAGAISLLASAMPGIDTVTNTIATAGGINAESDDALRARFANFIDSRSRATPAAIAFTIQSLQQGLTYILSENLDPAGASRPGFFTVTVDDGSGSPPATTLSAVSAALENIRPVGTQFAVQPPALQIANVALTIMAPQTSLATAQAAVVAAVTSYVASLPIGGTLPLSRLAAIAYGASSQITNVSAVTINGAASDLVPPASGIIKPGTVTVS